MFAIGCIYSSKKGIFLALIMLTLMFSGCHVFNQGTAFRKSIYPISRIKGELVIHNHYRLFYSEQHEGAYWVVYRLDSLYLSGNAQRKDNFKADPKVTTGSAHPDDYKGSGFDRGHLCPAASMTIDQTAMDESFYMSNMSPQSPSLNRGRWLTLEDQLREWVLHYDSLIVAVGPVYAKEYKVIGENEVAVPSQFYKIIWDGGERMIGFLFPNEKCPEPLIYYAVPVDSIESLTGFDFFSIIPNKIEKVIESTINTGVWMGLN